MLSDHAARRLTRLIRIFIRITPRNPAQTSASGLHRPQPIDNRIRFGNRTTGSERTLLFIGHFSLSRPVRIFIGSFKLTHRSVEYLFLMYRACNKPRRVWPR